MSTMSSNEWESQSEDNDNDDDNTDGGRSPVNSASRSAARGGSSQSSVQKKKRRRQKQSAKKSGPGSSRKRKDSVDVDEGALEEVEGFKYDAMAWSPTINKAVSTSQACLFPLFKKDDTDNQMQAKTAKLVYIKNLTDFDDAQITEAYLNKQVALASTKKSKNSVGAGKIVLTKATRGEVMLNFGWKTWMQTSSLWMKGIAIQAMDWMNTTSVGPPSIFGSFLSAENILAIVDFFPAEPELMKLAADRQADNTKVPTKAQFKASAEAQHTAATQNYVMMTTTLSDRVWPKQESEDPVSIFHNLQMSPKLWARVMGIILFTHSGNDCSIILKRAISIATGDNVWSDFFGPNGEGLGRANFIYAIRSLKSKFNSKHVYCMEPKFHFDATRAIKQVKRERAIEENQAACDAELKQLLSFMSDVDANNATIATPDDSDDEDLGSLVD